MVADVLVVGGGVVGVATANACAQRGMSVILCERAGLAAAASGRNQGLVIGPHPPALERIARRSVELWLGLHHQSGGAFLLDRSTIGYLAASPDGEGLQTAAALPGATLLEGDALRAAEPQLAGDVAGAVLIPDVRRIDPGAAVLALADEARRFGVTIHTGCDVKELALRRGVISGAYTDLGQVRAETVVIAAGPWSWRVCRSLGVDVPVRGVRGWLATTRPAPWRLNRPIEEHRDVWAPAAVARVTVADLAAGRSPEPRAAVVIQQDDAGRVLLGASLAPSVRDDVDDAVALRMIAERAMRLVPEIAKLEIAETRCCDRPVTPDGLPLHGPALTAGRLVLACGHGSQGITWGPGAGEAVATGIATDTWEPALLPDRFATSGASG